MATAPPSTACPYPEGQARHYDADYQAIGRTQDIPYYVELAREAKGPVMEMACGTGRVLLRVHMRWTADGEEAGEISDCRMRIVDRQELEELLTEAGLRTEQVFADFEMSPWEAERPRELVVLARRAGSSGRA
jgi:hypothetical protein